MLNDECVSLPALFLLFQFIMEGKQEQKGRLSEMAEKQADGRKEGDEEEGGNSTADCT